MNTNQNSHSQTQKETSEIMRFRFSESESEVKNLLIENKPWFVAKDVCSILELNDTNKALQKLDDDEKLTRKLFVSGQNRKMWLVSESGLYALILRSNKPQAKSFRKWITSEVIPTLLKKGYYNMSAQKSKRAYLDARDVPHYKSPLNGYEVACIDLENETWVLINDVKRAIHTTTDSTQIAKKLNAKQTLAKKIWLFGQTHPAWFTNKLGVQLMLAGSRKIEFGKQLKLEV